MKRAIVLLSLACAVSISAFAFEIDTVKISLPSLRWALQLKLPGFEVQSMDLNNQCEGRQLSFLNDSLNMEISVNMEENTRHMNNPREMRDSSWMQISRFFKERHALVLDSSKYETENCAFSDFHIATINGLVVNQRNIIVYLLHSDICISLQIIKSNFKDTDEKDLENLLHNIKLIAPYIHTSLEHFVDGSAYFENGNYRMAAKVLQKALDTATTDRLLNKDQLYRVMADLGLAYGLSGELGKAVTVLNKAIRMDGYFPMFYYNLAAVYAQTNDVTETIYYLWQASQYKKNMPAGNKLPQPQKDELFRQLWDNKQFKEAVRNM